MYTYIHIYIVYSGRSSRLKKTLEKKDLQKLFSFLLPS